MTIIEKRAYAAVGVKTQGSELPADLQMMYDGYVIGAKEQREIDIDKACSILRQIGVFDLLSAEEGLSAACMEEQFRETMKQ